MTDGQTNTQEGVASICNHSGRLLFYTDGVSFWDRTHQTMPFGDGTLGGSGSSAQSAIILPDPGSDSLFYVFTIQQLSRHIGFAYTVVEMTLPGNGSLNNPLGAVVPGTLKRFFQILLLKNLRLLEKRMAKDIG